jgi:UDP-glucose 4-epimerase
VPPAATWDKALVDQTFEKVVFMKILVTGGAGFIGANLVRMLIERSYRVTVLDDLSVGKLDYLKNLELGFIEGSILDPNVVWQAIEWADSVIHLAAQTSVVNSIAHPIGDDFSINVMGSVNILDVCKAVGTKRFVFASSNAAKQHVSPYGASKRAIEGYCTAYHSAYGLGTITLRLANVYGPYSKHKNSVVAKWFKSIIDKGEITIEGGEQTRDFIHVEDVCRAIIAALESNVSGEIFQVGTEIKTSISQLATTIAQQINGVKIKYEDPRQSDTKRIRSNITKVGEMLNWQPTVNLTDGLKDTWEWFNR